MKFNPMQRLTGLMLAAAIVGAPLAAPAFAQEAAAPAPAAAEAAAPAPEAAAPAAPAEAAARALAAPLRLRNQRQQHRPHDR